MMRTTSALAGLCILLGAACPAWAQANVSGSYSLTGSTTNASGPQAGQVPTTWAGTEDLTQPTGSTDIFGSGTLNTQTINETGFISGGVISIFIGGFSIGTTPANIMLQGTLSTSGTIDGTMTGQTFDGLTTWSGTFSKAPPAEGCKPAPVVTPCLYIVHKLQRMRNGRRTKDHLCKGVLGAVLTGPNDKRHEIVCTIQDTRVAKFADPLPADWNRDGDGQATRKGAICTPGGSPYVAPIVPVSIEQANSTAVAVFVDGKEITSNASVGVAAYGMEAGMTIYHVEGPEPPFSPCIFAAPVPPRFEPKPECIIGDDQDLRLSLVARDAKLLYLCGVKYRVLFIIMFDPGSDEDCQLEVKRVKTRISAAQSALFVAELSPEVLETAMRIGVNSGAFCSTPHSPLISHALTCSTVVQPLDSPLRQPNLTAFKPFGGHCTGHVQWRDSLVPQKAYILTTEWDAVVITKRPAGTVSASLFVDGIEACFRVGCPE